MSKNFQRQVNALPVFCRYKDSECGWRGKLSDLECHIQSCPMKDTPLMTDILKSPLYVDYKITRDSVDENNDYMLLSTDIIKMTE